MELGWVDEPPAARETGKKEKNIMAGKAGTSLDVREVLGCHLIPVSVLQG